MFVIIYKLYLNHIMFKYKIDYFHLWNDLFTEKQAKTLRELKICIYIIYSIIEEIITNHWDRDISIIF